MNEKKILSIEAMPYYMLEKLKIERAEIESQPEPRPEKLSFLEKFSEAEKERFAGELAQVITDIVAVAARNINDTFSPERLIESVKDVYRKEIPKAVSPYLMLKCLPLLITGIEKELNGRTHATWASRCNGIDRQIQQWTAKVPKPFTPPMINTETMGPLVHGSKELRFPADRVSMADGKYYDKWLTDFLKSKPVFFEPNERYVESLMECYNVYLVEAEKEKKASTQQAIAQEKAVEKAAQPPEPAADTYRIPDNEPHLLREQDAERSALWQGSRRR